MSTRERPDTLPITVRVFTLRGSPSEYSGGPPDPVSKGPKLRRRLPGETLVFDLETADEPAQRLDVGAWRLYRDRPGATVPEVCVEEGLLFADDLATRDPAGYARLAAYVHSRAADVSPGFPGRLVLMSASEWLERRLFAYGYRHRDRCAIVGYHVSFDLGALARHVAPASGYYRGGFSLGFWGEHDAGGSWHDRRFHPRLLVKAIDPRRTLFGWGSLKRADADGKVVPGNVVDLKTLVFALTDKSHTLESACAAFGDPWEKAAVEYGEVGDQLFDYVRGDVQRTAALYGSCLAELRRHPGIDLPPARLYSPATVGTRYLEAMGLRRPLLAFTDLAPWELGWDLAESQVGARPIDRRILGWGLSAFFGGRAAGWIVRTPVPVIVLDAVSMYALVNANLGTWRLLTAEHLKARDVASEVRDLLAEPDLLARCLTRAFWQDVLGVTLVELEDPEGTILPVRAAYDPDSPDPGIGVNPLWYAGRLWYMLPDVVGSALLGGKVPRVRRAIRLVGTGQQTGLRQVQLRGRRTFDPRTGEDPYLALIEERYRVKNDEELSVEERERVDRFLKITASATGYGILARFDRRELRDTVPVTVHGPDDEPMHANTANPEDPGPYAFPPIAAAITAGARLMLAILEHLATDAGGTYAFCDTDSMAVVAKPEGGPVECQSESGGKVQALSFEKVRQIVGRFSGLNPFDPGLVPDVWKVEHDSMTKPLTCWVTSAKRYVLFREAAEQAVELVAVRDESEELEDPRELADWSEHGLGLYADPIGRRGSRPNRLPDRRRTWMAEAWTYLLERAAGKDPPLPDWSGRFALTQFTVSSPAIQRWFRGRDDGVPRSDRMRPGSFGLLAQPAELVGGLAGRRLPAAPYEDDPEEWRSLPWYDRLTGNPIEVVRVDPSDPDVLVRAIERGLVPIRTLGDVLTTYDRRPEHKSLAPDGSSAGPLTTGQLRRRPVQSTPALTLLAGKEGSKLLERALGVVTEAAEYAANFGFREDPWDALVIPVLRRMGVSAVVKQTSPSWRRSIQRMVAGDHPSRPRRRRKDVLTRVAADHARQQLADRGIEANDKPSTCLAEYLRQSPDPPRLCRCGCGMEIPGRATWASSACRKRIARRQVRRSPSSPA